MNMIRLTGAGTTLFSKKFLSGFVQWDLVPHWMPMAESDFEEQFGLFCMGGEL